MLARIAGSWFFGFMRTHAASGSDQHGFGWDNRIDANFTHIRWPGFIHVVYLLAGSKRAKYRYLVVLLSMLILWGCRIG